MVACCGAWLEGATHCMVPFRVKLADLAPLLSEADSDCWLALRKCLAQTHGRGSMYTLALEQALAQAEDLGCVGGLFLEDGPEGNWEHMKILKKRTHENSKETDT